MLIEAKNSFYLRWHERRLPDSDGGKRGHRAEGTPPPSESPFGFRCQLLIPCVIDSLKKT